MSGGSRQPLDPQNVDSLCPNRSGGGPKTDEGTRIRGQDDGTVTVPHRIGPRRVDVGSGPDLGQRGWTGTLRPLVEGR